MDNSAKRFAVLTYAFSDNSGSVLQAYALKRTIEKNTGAVVTTLNYQKTGMALKPVFGYNIFYGNVKTWTPKKIAAWIGQIILFPVRIRKHFKFSKTYLNFNSNRAAAKEKLCDISGSFDKIVVGSDQVWGVNDSTYFLDFVDDDRKKVSYAASFGKDRISNEQSEMCVPLLKRFYATSVREYQGVDLFRELTGMETKLVLDPSLLLTAAEWD